MNGNMVVYRERKENEPTKVTEREFIIYCEGASMYHVASFKTEDQLKKFCDLIGVTYEWDEILPGRKVGKCSHTIEHDARDCEIEEEFKKNWRTAYYGKDDVERVAARKWLDEHDRYDTERSAYCITKENLRLARSIKALSNGSIVDCYVTNDGECVRIYRCNPNSKKFYNPLSIDEHIKFVNAHGIY